LEGKPVLEFCDYADAVTTSTETLAEYIRKLRPNALVKCIPDRIYLPEAKPLKTFHNDSLNNVVWFGYAQNIHYLYNTFDTLISQNITLTIISNEQFDVPMAYRGTLKVNNVPYSYSTINKEIIKCDAVLLPDPKSDQRGLFKSDNKTLQSWALGMPVIKVPKDMERFRSKEVRIEEGKKVRNYIEENYNVKKSVDEYRELIKEIKARKRGV